MIDTHCHLTSQKFAGQVDQIIANANANGVHTLISVATGVQDSVCAKGISHEYENVYFSAGIHPLYAEESRDWGQLREQLLKIGKDAKCVAWGELGLDRHYKEPPFKLQQQLLENQIEFIESQEADLKPIIVHCRKAVKDLLPIFKSSHLTGERFVFHCFAEEAVDARKVLDFGAMISFTGVVTYKNATEVVDSARLVPLERMMVETDAPYLSPEPVRLMRPNEPKNVRHVSNFLAKLKGLSAEDFEQTMDQNAITFFRLNKERGETDSQLDSESI